MATAAAAVVASLLSVGAARADSFSVVGGWSETLPSSFSPTGWSNPDNVGVGSSIQVFNTLNCFSAGCGGLFVDPGNVSVTFTYLGFEANHVDVADATFSYGGTPMFTNTTTGVGNSQTVTYNLGTGSTLLPFLFADTATHPDDVAKNGGPLLFTEIAYAVVDSSTVYAFFDDTGSPFSPDFDDMVVKITFASTQGAPGDTPLPAALPLFAGGLGVLGLLGWRKKKAARA